MKSHPDYDAAKAGDASAALRLVEATLSTEAVERVRTLGRDAILVPVHAFESTGVNAIPLALAEEVGRRLKLAVAKSIVQVNLVGHTGASGFARLARQAVFDGDVEEGRDHVLVDDTSFAPRMLTASEIALLRSSLREIAEWIERRWAAGRRGPERPTYERRESRTRPGHVRRSDGARGDDGEPPARRTV